MKGENLTLLTVGALAAAAWHSKRGSWSSEAQRIAGYKAPVPLKTEDYRTTITGPKGTVHLGPDGVAAMAQVANNQYKGFMVWMSPETFGHLNPARRNSPIFFEETIKAGASIGIPWLDVKVTSPRELGTPETFQVVGHEGRTRMRAIAATVGKYVKVPVAVSIRQGFRGHDFKPQNIARAKFLPDSNAVGGWPWLVQDFALNGLFWEQG